jgi:hypothetical protein
VAAYIASSVTLSAKVNTPMAVTLSYRFKLGRNRTPAEGANWGVTTLRAVALLNSLLYSA